MTSSSPAVAAASALAMRSTPRALVIGLIGFLTLVDLFGAQAILPTLVSHYGVSPAAMGLAVNACTIGMAVSGLIVSLVARRIDRRRGIWVCLALLAIPTAALASAPDLAVFAALRITQGVFMAAAFTLTMTYLAERAGPEDTAAALSAYVTGVVGSNLVGRLVAGSVADVAGLEVTFYVFAGLNLAGAALVALALQPGMKTALVASLPRSAVAAWAGHLANPALRAAFLIGFLILFVFIGTFTYVNFELAKPPLGLSPMHLGFVYLVFLPAMVTTPMAGRLVGRWGARALIRISLVGCVLALPLIQSAQLSFVLVGLAIIGVGTFFAQAVATGFVASTAQSDRAAASGLYLTSYYLGGLAGAAMLGQIYDAAGWERTLAVIGLALMLAVAASAWLTAPFCEESRT